jgi:hypothetical protein
MDAAAGLAVGTLSGILVAPCWLRGKQWRNDLTEGQERVFLSVVHILSFSLSTNHVSLSLSLSPRFVA